MTPRTVTRRALAALVAGALALAVAGPVDVPGTGALTGPLRGLFGWGPRRPDPVPTAVGTLPCPASRPGSAPVLAPDAEVDVVTFPDGSMTSPSYVAEARDARAATCWDLRVDGITHFRPDDAGPPYVGIRSLDSAGRLHGDALPDGAQGFVADDASAAWIETDAGRRTGRVVAGDADGARHPIADVTAEPGHQVDDLVVRTPTQVAWAAHRSDDGRTFTVLTAPGSGAGGTATLAERATALATAGTELVTAEPLDAFRTRLVLHTDGAEPRELLTLGHAQGDVVSQVAFTDRVLAWVVTDDALDQTRRRSTVSAVDRRTALMSTVRMTGEDVEWIDVADGTPVFGTFELVDRSGKGSTEPNYLPTGTVYALRSADAHHRERDLVRVSWGKSTVGGAAGDRLAWLFDSYDGVGVEAAVLVRATLWPRG